MTEFAKQRSSQLSKIYGLLIPIMCQILQLQWIFSAKFTLIPTFQELVPPTQQSAVEADQEREGDLQLMNSLHNFFLIGGNCAKSSDEVSTFL